MPLIPALRRQKQVDLCEFYASLVNRVSSRTARVTRRNPVSRKMKKRERERERDRDRERERQRQRERRLQRKNKSKEKPSSRVPGSCNPSTEEQGNSGPLATQSG